LLFSVNAIRFVIDNAAIHEKNVQKIEDLKRAALVEKAKYLLRERDYINVVHKYDSILNQGNKTSEGEPTAHGKIRTRRHL
jgi:hypothetical protein